MDDGQPAHLADPAAAVQLSQVDRRHDFCACGAARAVAALAAATAAADPNAPLGTSGRRDHAPTAVSAAVTPAAARLADELGHRLPNRPLRGVGSPTWRGHG